MDTDNLWDCGLCDAKGVETRLVQLHGSEYEACVECFGDLDTAYANHMADYEPPEPNYNAPSAAEGLEMAARIQRERDR